MHGLPALVAEGLDYFERSGDEGDRKYVAAIREHLAALRQSGEAAEYKVSYVSPLNFGGFCIQIASKTKLPIGTKLYTAPPATSGLVEAQQELVAACKQRDALDVECARLEQVADGLREVIEKWRHLERVPVCELDAALALTGESA